MSSKSSTHRDRSTHFLDCAIAILHKEAAIRAALSRIATARSIDDEIAASIAALKGADAELLREKPSTLGSLAVFHPSNVLLYSYILYCIIPSAYVDQIYLRPSSQVADELAKIHELLSPMAIGSVSFMGVGQRTFLRETRDSLAVVFTGKPENATEVARNYPDALFMYFGAGPNPFVLARDGIAEKFVNDAVAARLHNSGQDCMCPDILFVHASHLDEVLKRLRLRIAAARFGSLDDRYADYSTIVYENVVSDFHTYLSRNDRFVLDRGAIDLSTNRVDPVILLSNIQDMAEISEFFCPAFNVVSYEDESQIETLLGGHLFSERRFGVSIYGGRDLSAKLSSIFTVASDCSLFAIDDGNMPFGGFCKEASFVLFNGEYACRPLLLSREIARYFG